jgi:HD-GYP domain-containing protein (c-di-GMP phosphodiesterase class II)
MALADVGSSSPDTHAHRERVADLACDLARERGFNDRSMGWFRAGAHVHDAKSLLGALWLPWEVKPMVRHRHERWDGTGHPDRLCENEIPLSARILSIADAFDTLTTAGPDGEAYPDDVAVRIMADQAGKTFDPHLLRLFVTRTIVRLRRQGPTGGE